MFEGIDTQQKIKVALKIYHDIDDYSMASFKNEVRALQKLKDCKYVAKLYTSGKSKWLCKEEAIEVYFLALEYCSHGEFYEYVVKKKRFDEEMTKYYFR